MTTDLTDPRERAIGLGGEARGSERSPLRQVEHSEERAEYARRLEARREVYESRTRIDRWIADGRLAVFVGVVSLVLAIWFRSIVWWWLLAPVAAFLALLGVHERVRRQAARSARAIQYYERGLKRIEGTWAGTGVAGERFLELDHPYAADLDIFGEGSLFERICTARTRTGEETLAGWLLKAGEPATLRARQEGVEELRGRLDLREDIELLGADVREGIDPAALAAWGRETAVFGWGGTTAVARLLALMAMVGLICWATTELGTLPLMSVILLEAAFMLREKGKIRRVLLPIHERTHDLVLLGELLGRLERETFETAALTRIREALDTEGEPASRRIGKLVRLLNWLEMADNQFFAPIAWLLMWKPRYAIAIDGWRVRNGLAIEGWLAAVGEFEGICSLAGYAYENPADPFPVIEEKEACFEGEGVGHPLIPAKDRVRNDVKLGGELRVLLVSGSNMSGKSTMLRTVGVNTVLALAGAPVCAKGLRVSVLAVGGTLRIQDSLQAGRSRFYAEIRRIRQLVDLSRGTIPLLFLLDEIFHGTNSHDRTVGAEAVVLGLLERNAIGLVTTHDLALAAFADRLAPRARNVHFEDQLVDGEMKFDFKMRSGVVTHSNALALMRAVGLDV